MKLKRVNIAFLSILLLLPMLVFGQNKIGYIASERVRAEFEEFQEAEAQLQLDLEKCKKNIR